MGDLNCQEDSEICQEDAWIVIGSYFEAKGFVRQQLDSFDDFIQNTIQEVIDCSPDIIISQENQKTHALGLTEMVMTKVQFGQVYISKPTVAESDGVSRCILPKEARLRSLTYAASLYVDIKKTKTTLSSQKEKDAQSVAEERCKVFIGKVSLPNTTPAQFGFKIRLLISFVFLRVFRFQLCYALNSALWHLALLWRWHSSANAFTTKGDTLWWTAARK